MVRRVILSLPVSAPPRKRNPCLDTEVECEVPPKLPTPLPIFTVEGGQHFHPKSAHRSPRSRTGRAQCRDFPFRAPHVTGHRIAHACLPRSTRAKISRSSSFPSTSPLSSLLALPLPSLFFPAFIAFCVAPVSSCRALTFLSYSISVTSLSSVVDRYIVIAKASISLLILVSSDLLNYLSTTLFVYKVKARRKGI